MRQLRNASRMLSQLPQRASVACSEISALKEAKATKCAKLHKIQRMP